MQLCDCSALLLLRVQKDRSVPGNRLFDRFPSGSGQVDPERSLAEPDYPTKASKLLGDFSIVIENMPFAFHKGHFTRRNPEAGANWDEQIAVARRD